MPSCKKKCYFFLVDTYASICLRISLLHFKAVLKPNIYYITAYQYLNVMAAMVSFVRPSFPYFHLVASKSVVFLTFKDFYFVFITRTNEVDITIIANDK